MEKIRSFACIHHKYYALQKCTLIAEHPAFYDTQKNGKNKRSLEKSAFSVSDWISCVRNHFLGNEMLKSYGKINQNYGNSKVISVSPRYCSKSSKPTRCALDVVQRTTHNAMQTQLNEVCWHLMSTHPQHFYLVLCWLLHCNASHSNA